MKLLIRDYLGSLREREELDAILPDLLSELGFAVFSRPQRGTAQRGVDVAAVGKDENGETKLFLFSVKQGSLSRQDWDGSPQALRSSLNEIRDAYIRNRVPAKYKHLRVVICIVLGGDVSEQVRELLSGYIHENSTERIAFDEWNGDKLSELLLTGVLREEVLPKQFRSHFQKSVAMVDEPEISYAHFSKLGRLILAEASTAQQRVRACRQLSLCLWILFVWARDSGNLEAAYRASELGVLLVWQLAKQSIDRKTKHGRELESAVRQMISLHNSILLEFLDSKVLPYTSTRHALSLASGGRSALDVNLALFRILGRIALAGLWLSWTREQSEDPVPIQRKVEQMFTRGLELIESNPALLLPIADRQATELSLFLVLWLKTEDVYEGMPEYLSQMTARLVYSVRTNGRYPTCQDAYVDLLEHTERNSRDLGKSMAGSTLIPLLSCWLEAVGDRSWSAELSKLAQEELQSTNFQFWIPDRASDEHLYLNDATHGKALSNLPVEISGAEVVAAVARTCHVSHELFQLSAMKEYWPIVLVACRHYRLPIPPHFWIENAEYGCVLEDVADVSTAAEAEI